MRVQGKIIRFDTVRGFGFVAAETGGEDVFVHANDLEVDKSLLTPGAIVEFRVEEGDRGLKASEVRLVSDPGIPVRSGGGHSARVDYDDNVLCDSLSAKEYRDEVTEVLLAAVPTMTSAQILQARDRLLRHAENHGWIED
ncbi:cold-shock protein [Streptomyces sp. NPDC059009]|uniref:cold-shock protein n=1 Tax=Streptomyces sp. NPDC059009 TaxID=3346694 RepID=UPI0036B4F177